MLASHVEERINVVISNRICQYGSEDSFFVFDAEALLQQWNLWMTHLSQVVPHYAVKCNNHREILSRLISWGSSFDCASQAELEMVLSLGARPDQIVYANPVKAPSQLRFASENGVKRMTFDNAHELHKIKAIAPTSELLLRIKTDDSGAICSLSCKFGAAMECIESLLETASLLNLNVIGVAYHVGSGGGTGPEAHAAALRNARKTFELGAKFGFNFIVLDIGGGFESNAKDFEAVADEIKSSFSALQFPKETVLISEPGRLLVAPTMTLVTQVIGVRRTPKIEEIDMIYLTDGVYGNLNSIIYDHQHPKGYLLANPGDNLNNTIKRVSLWGPTCDGLDSIDLSANFPRPLEIGDWVYFPESGAYTLVGESTFNGFNTNTQVYVAEKKLSTD